jgi:hypothetical protein
MIFDKARLAKFMNAFGYFMAVLYIGLGSALFFHRVLPAIPKTLKITFSFFFIAYGLFRFVKLRTGDKENKEGDSA